MAQTGKRLSAMQETRCKRGSCWEAAAQHRGLSSALCDDPEAWDGGGRDGGPREMGYTADSLRYEQKLTQHCKKIIFQ